MSDRVLISLSVSWVALMLTIAASCWLYRHLKRRN